MSELERRYTSLAVELRATDDKARIGGYAAVFNKQSRNLGGFVETIDPAAFNKSRGDGWPEVIARYNHDDNQLLGTIAGGTLRLAIDDTGLLYEVDPPKSRADILELVQRGDVRKSSFAFRTMDDDWALTDQGFPLRSLLSAQLVDVAPVNIPAYADTSAGLRSLAVKFHVEFEEVRSMAAADELKKFFVRTDRDGKPVPKTKLTLGASARMKMLSREQDPWA